MHGITKRIFLASRDCLRQGWYIQNAASTEPASDANKFRTEQGQLIGQQARLLCPGGILIQERRLGDATRRTAKLLVDSEVSAILEAAFRWNDCTTRADLLIRENGGWTIKEVKSALADSEPPDELIDDVTYTVMVARGAGLSVERCSLLLLSGGFRLGMPPQDLFVEIDVTAAVETRLPEFAASLDQIKAALSRPAPPPARLIPACRDCEFFDTECLGHSLKHPVIEIPRLHRNRLAALADRGIVEILAVPDDFPLSATQRIAVSCVKTDREYIGPSLSVNLAKMQWPASY